MRSEDQSQLEIWHTDNAGKPSEALGYAVSKEEEIRIQTQRAYNLQLIHANARVFVFPESFFEFGELPTGPPDVWQNLRSVIWPFEMFAIAYEAGGDHMRVYVAWDQRESGQEPFEVGEYRYDERIYVQPTINGVMSHITGVYGRKADGSWGIDYFIDLRNVELSRYEEVRHDTPRVLRSIMFCLYGFAQALRHKALTSEPRSNRAERRQQKREGGVMDGPSFNIVLRPGASVHQVLEEVRNRKGLKPGYPKRRHFVDEYQRTYKKTGLTVTVTPHYRGGKRGLGPAYVVDPRLVPKKK